MSAGISAPPEFLSLRGIRKTFGDRVAVDGVDLDVVAGQVIGILGPNGGGKTTLFRILSSLIRPDSGTLHLGGVDLESHPSAIRSQLGVVFQAPSLDNKLTVAENLVHQGHLYGMSGAGLKEAVERELNRAGITDRRKDLVETLSGGLKRRAEIAKALLHSPKILLLDEPSTGLDPGARNQLWQNLFQLREDFGTTILLTTHLIDEADRCDRVAIMDSGKILAIDTPEVLRSAVGGDVITITTDSPAELALEIRDALQLDVKVVDGTVRIEHPAATDWIGKLSSRFAGRAAAFTIGKPTLEDVFIRITGRKLEPAGDLA